MDQFDLGRARADHELASLPGGYQQRLAMAAALAARAGNPVPRRADERCGSTRRAVLFWRRITALAEQGVTIIVTTHFMQEAEYCDGMADHGFRPHPRAGDAGADPRARSRRRSGRTHHGRCVYSRRRALPRPGAYRSARPRHEPAKLVRLRALVIKETRQVVRDPSSIAIGVVLPLILIVLFGYGLSLDVKNVPIALVLEYPTPEALDLASGFQLSPYFRPLIQRSMPPAMRLLREHQVDGIVRISAGFLAPLRGRPGARCSSSCTAATPTALGSSRAMCRESCGVGGPAGGAGTGHFKPTRQHRGAAVVQRGQRQQLLPGARTRSCWS